MSDRVFIFDTTLRDGEQSCGCSMTVPEKMRMARKLVELNVDVMEAGFPMASDGDFEAVDRIGQEFGAVTVVRSKDGAPSLDLREANVALLRDAGVETVTVVEDCTSCSEALGSFRRQGPASYTLMLSCVGRWGRGT